LFFPAPPDGQASAKEEIEAIDTIKIELKTGELIEFIIVSDRPNLILARPERGIQYHISNTVSDNLFPTKPKTEVVPR